MRKLGVSLQQREVYLNGLKFKDREMKVNDPLSLKQNVDIVFPKFQEKMKELFFPETQQKLPKKIKKHRQLSFKQNELERNLDVAIQTQNKEQISLVLSTIDKYFDYKGTNARGDPKRIPKNQSLFLKSIKTNITIGNIEEAENYVFPIYTLPDLPPYLLLIEYYTKIRQPSLSLSTFNRMLERGVEIKNNTRIFTSLFRSCSYSEETSSEIFSLLEQMKILEISPNIHHFNEILFTWKKIASNNEGEKNSAGFLIHSFFELLKAHQLSPNSTTFIRLFEIVCENLNHIEITKDYLNLFDIKFNLAIKIALLRAYMKANHFSVPIFSLINSFHIIPYFSISSSQNSSENNNKNNNNNNNDDNNDVNVNYIIPNNYQNDQSKKRKPKTEITNQLFDHSLFLTSEKSLQKRNILLNSALKECYKYSNVNTHFRSIWDIFPEHFLTPTVNSSIFYLKYLATFNYKFSENPKEISVNLVRNVWSSILYFHNNPPLRLFHSLLRCYVQNKQTFYLLNQFKYYYFAVDTVQFSTFKIVFAHLISQNFPFDQLTAFLRLMNKKGIAFEHIKSYIESNKYFSASQKKELTRKAKELESNLFQLDVLNNFEFTNSHLLFDSLLDYSRKNQLVNNQNIN